MTKKTYFVEVTDTYGGETNYCWIRRYAVQATTERGAMRVVGNHEGYAMRNDGWRWDFVGACICAYVVDEVQAEDACRYVKLN
jgi:hypothetical protein